VNKAPSNKVIEAAKPGILKRRTLSDVLSSRPASPALEMGKFERAVGSHGGGEERGRRRSSLRRVAAFSDHDEDTDDTRSEKSEKSERSERKHITFALDDYP
jgi:hypothetical protein